MRHSLTNLALSSVPSRASRSKSARSIAAHRNALYAVTVATLGRSRRFITSAPPPDPAPAPAPSSKNSCAHQHLQLAE